MVKKLVLFDKIYNLAPRETPEELFERYFSYMEEYIKDFPDTNISIKKMREYDQRIEIEIEGPEELFFFNVLTKEIGTIRDFKDLNVGTIYKGNLIDVGKVGFGLFVDCGIFKPEADVLVTLQSLRTQLCGDKKKSLKEIARAYDFIDHFPVAVKITKLDSENHEIFGEFSDETVDFFKDIVRNGLEGIFVSGATKSQFKKVIEKTRHARDVVSIQRYGFLENIALFKKGTDAPGIISHVGKSLRSCQISALRPERIRLVLK